MDFGVAEDTLEKFRVKRLPRMKEDRDAPSPGVLVNHMAAALALPM
jgi:hypothetical protein